MADIQEYSVSIKFETKGSDKAANDMEKVQKSTEGMKGATKALSGIGVALGGIGGVATKVAGILGSFVNVQTFSKLGSQAAENTKRMADYIESVNLFRASMGAAADQAQEFIDKAETKLGLDPEQMMQSISSFYNLADGLGIAGDRAYTMSQNLTQLAGDLSSFANISFETAQQKLMSGFSGQVKPLREYGIALDQASLQELAYSLGIEQRVKTMTRAQKTELIYYQIMKSTQKMQGDLSRTIISPANGLRIMQTEFKKLARAVGSIFIPMMMKIIPVVRAVTQALTAAAQSIARFFGFEMSDFNADLSSVGNLLDGVVDDIDDMGDSAEGTAKSLNKMLMPFDELNNLTTNSGSGGGSSGTGGIGSGGSLGLDLPTYDMFQGDGLANLIASGNWKKAIEDAAKTINEKLGQIPWEDIQKNTRNGIENFVGAINTGITSINWNLVGNTIGEGLNTAIGAIYTFLETFDFASAGKALGDTMTGLFDTIDWAAIGTIFSDALIGIMEFVDDFFINFDLDKVNNAIGSIISGIDWMGLLKRLAKHILIAWVKFNPFMIIVKQTLKLIGEGINWIIDRINDGLSKIPDYIKEKLNLPKELGHINLDMDDWLKHLSDATEKSIDEMVGDVEEGTEEISDSIETAAGNTDSVTQETLKNIAEKHQEMISNLTGGSNSLAETMTGNWNSLASVAQEDISNTESAFKSSYDAMGDSSVFTKLNNAVKDALDKSDKSKQWGQDTSDNFAKGLASDDGSLMGVIKNIENKMKEGLNQSQKARGWGTSTINELGEGLNPSGSGLVQKLSTIQGKIKSALGDAKTAHTWATDMMTGFSNGIIDAMKQKLKDAVKKAAGSIASLLHFSRPDEGPLRDYETWMPDMIKGLSDTMLNALPILSRATAQVSEAVANRLSEIDVNRAYENLALGDISTNVMTEIRARTSVANQDNAAKTLANATYTAINRALEQNSNSTNPQQIIVNVGDREVYRGYGKYQDERSNMLGVSVS